MAALFVALILDHQNIISECFCQIWKTSVEAFVIYCVHKIAQIEGYAAWKHNASGMLSPALRYIKRSTHISLDE